MRKQLFLATLLFLTLAFTLFWQNLIGMPESALQLNPLTLWQTTSVDGDALAYLRLAQGQPDSAPYKYRLAGVEAARLLGGLMQLPTALAYLVLNTLCFVGVGVGFTAYLMRFYRFAYPLALVGGFVAVATVGMSGTLLLPMLEPVSYAAALLLFWTLSSRSAVGFVAASALAVATKEVFVVSAILWIALVGRDWRRWWPALAPVVTFIGLHLLLGGGILDVNYGYNVAAGQFPLDYLSRFWTPALWPDLVWRTLLAFGAVWLGVMAFRRSPFLRRVGPLYIVLVLLATLLLSSRITRVIGILYPVLVPGFLYVLEPPRPGAEPVAR